MPDIGESGRFPALDVAAYERSLAQTPATDPTPAHHAPSEPVHEHVAQAPVAVPVHVAAPAPAPSIHDTQPLAVVHAEPVVEAVVEPHVAVASVEPVVTAVGHDPKPLHEASPGGTTAA